MSAHLRKVAGLSLVAAFATASLGADSRAATSVVATSPSPMHARAYGGRVVWAELGDPGWQLKTLEAGRPVDLPIAPFKSDGALDVGPGEDGTPTLVFSRCERTAEGGTTGCDVFRYDFATRAETPVSTVNSDAIESLPARQRTAILLFHFQDFSQRDAAGVMGISEDAFESMLARARRQLKRLIGDSEGGGDV